jgi:3D (Asp-Asp-Asp) domain-containing protein
LELLTAIIDGIRKARKYIKKARLLGKGLDSGKKFLQMMIGMLLGYLKGFMIYAIIAAIIVGALIGGITNMFNFFKVKTGGVLTADKIIAETNKLSASQLEELRNLSGGINPKKIVKYAEVENSSYPQTVNLNMEVINDGKSSKVPYTLKLSDTSAQFRTPWQFVASLDLVKYTGDDEKDLELINGAKTTLKPTFNWAYDKYTKDVTDSSKQWVVETKKDSSTGVVTEVSNGQSSARQIDITKKYPLPFASSVITPFKTYTYHFKEDVKTKNDPWSKPVVVGTPKEWDEQVADGTVTDTTKPIYGNPTYRFIVNNGTSTTHEKITPEDVKLPSNPSLQDKYVWTPGLAYDDNFYIFNEANKTDKLLWIKKTELNYNYLISGKYTISFDGTITTVNDVTDYGTKTKYKTVHHTQTTYKIIKQVVIEDMISYVDEDLNPQPLISFLDGQKINTADLQLVHDSLEAMPNTSEIQEDVQRVVDGNYANGGLGNIGGGGTIDPTLWGSEIPLFHQWDKRWGSIPYGSHGTLASSACGPTSAAMVITGLGGKMDSLDTNHDGIVDPPESAAYSVAHGYRAEEGTAWGFFADIGAKAGLNVKQYSTSQYAEVLNQLKQGHPVIASMRPGHFTSGGHFIVLASVLPDGKIKVNDPNRQICSDTPWDFMSVIVAEAAQFWAFDNPNVVTQAFLATAYDLSYQSCQKLPSDPGYGVTASGVSLKGKDISGKYIAVDKTLIPLGAKVYLKFPPGNNTVKTKNGTTVQMDGWYNAVDTGGAVKGRHIDLYMGEDIGAEDYYSKLCSNWGKVNIQIQIPPK